MWEQDTRNTKIKQGVCCTVALPFYIKKISLRQKKNYGNSNILPHKKKKTKFQKNPQKETKIVQDIIIIL